MKSDISQLEVTIVPALQCLDSLATEKMYSFVKSEMLLEELF